MSRDYNKIAKNIAREGFFSEYLPPCFSVSEKVFKYIPNENCDIIEPYHFTMSKHNNTDSRRVISIPEIGAYLVTYNYMKENDIFRELIEFTETSIHSFSPILDSDNNVYMHDESYEKWIENGEPVKATYIKNVVEKIIRSKGARKIFKLDIANCYSSFYTHMIPAILLGYEKTEEEYNKFIKNDQENIDEVYLKYKKLDDILRKQNLNRTNGLLTGTIFSKIISEAILTRIDKELDEQRVNYVRYVDDYEIFLYDDNEKQIESIFSKILKKYGFSINSEKKEIMEFPFYIIENLEKMIGNKLSQGDIVTYIKNEELIELFNEFYIMEKKGTKGAIRYLLKTLENKAVSFESEELFKSYLITSMTNNDRSLTKACNVFIKHKERMRLNDNESSIIIEMLEKNITNSYDLECVWLIYLLLKMGVYIPDDIISKVLNSDNELMHCILINIGNLKDDQLNVVVSNAKSWLLLYELYYNNHITEEEFLDRANIDKNKQMYIKLKNNNIHFVS